MSVAKNGSGQCLMGRNLLRRNRNMEQIKNLMIKADDASTPTPKRHQLRSVIVNRHLFPSRKGLTKSQYQISIPLMNYITVEALKVQLTDLN